MSYEVVLSTLKFVSAISTALFGLFAVGAKTRHDSGALTRYGWIAIAGLAVTLFVALASQIFEELKVSEDRKVAAERLERLVRSSLYGALSTQEARIGIQLRIPADIIKVVEPNYAARVLSALDPTSCKVETKRVGMHANYYYRCAGYTVVHDWLDGRFVRFAADSPLLPDPKAEPFASALLSRAAVGIRIGDFSEQSFWGDPAFAVRYFQDEISYVLDGTSLEMTVPNVRAPANYLADRNLNSMVDLAGKRINVYAAGLSEKCPEPSSPKCAPLEAALDSIELWRFALIFPHRSDLVFDRVGHLMQFEEKMSDNNRRYYSYTFPANVEDFIKADRIDPFRR